ncbi:nucleotide exchange factor GrpE [Mycolicibacterium sp. HS_4_1]
MSVNDEVSDTVPSAIAADEQAHATSTTGPDCAAARPDEADQPDHAPPGPDDEAKSADIVPGDELAAMADALERFHSRAEQYESIIRRMQSRIEELQADQVRELLKPVILKLASLHTEAAEAEARASTREDDSARKDFDYFVSEIEEVLSLLDIESIKVSTGDEFDASKHAARRRVDTDDPSLDRRVGKILRQGFTFVGAERVFVPAMVNVYRYVAPEPAVVASAAPETTN